MYQNSVVANDAGKKELEAGIPKTDTKAAGRDATVDADPYCDYQWSEMTKDTAKFINVTKSSSVAGNSFNGHMKCTY